jgi:AAA domain
MLGAGEISCFFGRPAAGKSSLVGDLACHVATPGMNWFGKPVRHGLAIYVAAERASVVRRRVAAFRKHHKIEDAALAVLGGSPDLCHHQLHALDIVEQAKRLCDQFGLPVELVIIETVSRVLAGGNENAPGDMGNLVGNVEFIREKTEAHILLVHHTPLGTERMRGHTSLLGACDTTVNVQAESGDIRTATVDKANDADEGQAIAFCMKSVELRRDPDGLVTAAPVVIQTARPTAEQKRKPLSDNENAMLVILREAGPRGLSQMDWYNAAREAGIGVARPATLTNVRDKLMKKGLVHDDHGMWRVVRKMEPIHRTAASAAGADAADADGVEA